MISLAERLSPLEKVSLIERVAPQIERDLFAVPAPRGVSLLGLARDLGPAPSAGAIDDARREAWSAFPRETT